MEVHNIFKQLTTNLAFNKEPVVGSKRKLVRSEEKNNVVEEEKGENVHLNESPCKKAKTESATSLKSSTKPTKTISLKNLEQMKIENTNHIRNLHHINVNGEDIPQPIESFDQLEEFQDENKQKLSQALIDNLAGYNFSELTPVQMQAISVMLNNREVMVSAPTGSGKTISYLFPILGQLSSHKNIGVRALIISPTRELARQIYVECCRLSQGMSLSIHINSKLAKELKKPKFSPNKFDILISTPAKLIKLLKKEKFKKCLECLEWMIIDEADRLFEDGEKGFRKQLAKIYKACDNPKLKHGLFSATYTNEVEQWCKLNLNNMIQISIGRRNVASLSIEQQLIYVGTEQGKLMALKNLFRQGFEPPILVFVQSKSRANDLFKELMVEKFNVDMISADRTEQQRDNTIRSFRLGKVWILICTELMSRGIDFKYVNMVVNYDFPMSAISYIHRIGRSGRAGNIGKAVTFFSDSDLPHLRTIANVMKEAGCEVPDFMLKLKKPSKKEKRNLAKKAPKRKKISTV